VKDTLYLYLKDEALQNLMDLQVAMSSPGDAVESEAGDEAHVEEDDYVSEAQVHWVLAPDGVVTDDIEAGSLEDVVNAVVEDRGGLFGLDIILILQGSHVFSTTVNIPSKQSKHIAQALPFMLEDNVAEDVEQLHFAPGSRDDEGNVGVLAIRKNEIESLVRGFEAAGLPLTAILPDMLCLPAHEDEWMFVTDGHQLITRTSQYQALSIELDALPILLNSLFSEDSEVPAPSTLKVRVTQEFKSENFENWLKSQITSHIADTDTKLDLEHVESSEFLYICDRINSDTIKQSNLLVGRYKSVAKRAPSLFNWQPMAALASIFLVLFVGFQYFQASTLKDQAVQADVDAKALYRKYFPQDKRVFDVKKQMQSHLKNANKQGDGIGFLPLLAQVGKEMNKMNRLAKTQVINPLRISFDEVQGELRIDCTAPGFKDLDKLKQMLEDTQLIVEIARASQDGDKIKARINVRSAS